MSRRTLFGLLGVGLAALAVYRLGRELIARLLGLSPPRYAVAVERKVAIPMPDGVTLMADHYAPRAPGRFPTVLMRSPYGRAWEAGIFGLMSIFSCRRIAERGYHVVVQTTRGRFDSGGTSEPFFDDTRDGRATLDWVARQPWFDGNLGMWGASYLGYVQWAVAADAPPYLKALCPAITGSQFYSITYPDGAFALDTALRWTALVHAIGLPGQKLTWDAMRRGSPASQEPLIERARLHLPLCETDVIVAGAPVRFYRDWLAHTQPDDPYWRAIDHSAGVARVTAPAHFVSGWYDILLRELLADYAALRSAGRRPYLTIGPWSHLDFDCVWATLREGITWLDACLKGDRSRLRSRPVRIRVMGADVWRELDHWPPPVREERYFLHARRLAAEEPEPSSPPDRYRYDPADPTPAVGGPQFNQHAGKQDNSALEARPDVICYTTAPLAHDLEVIGTPRLVLYVHSSLAHADFVGRICDVAPDGRSTNVCDGMVRVAPGTGAVQPDGSLRLEIELWPTAQRFQRGHAIRLQVSSGAHPRWSRNLGTGEPLATGVRMAIAEQTIYHDAAHPSALVLPVVEPASL